MKPQHTDKQQAVYKHLHIERRRRAKTVLERFSPFVK